MSMLLELSFLFLRDRNFYCWRFDLIWIRIGFLQQWRLLQEGLLLLLLVSEVLLLLVRHRWFIPSRHTSFVLVRIFNRLIDELTFIVHFRDEWHLASTWRASFDNTLFEGILPKRAEGRGIFLFLRTEWWWILFCKVRWIRLIIFRLRATKTFSCGTCFLCNLFWLPTRKETNRLVYSGGGCLQLLRICLNVKWVHLYKSIVENISFDNELLNAVLGLSSWLEIDKEEFLHSIVDESIYEFFLLKPLCNVSLLFTFNLSS